MSRAGVCIASAIVAFAIGSLAAQSAARGSGAAVSGTSTARTGTLRLTVPRGFDQYDTRGGLYKAGTRPPVIGHVVTDYRLPAHSPLRRGVFPMSQPERKVALELQLWDGLAAIPPSAIRLHLPLSLHQRWFHERVPAGFRRYGYLRVKRQLYEVIVWTGRQAKPLDRDALLRALASIHRTH